MTQLTNFKEIPIQEVYDSIELHQDNPSCILRSYLEFTDKIHDGEVEFLDGTNPTIMYLEMASVGHSSALRAYSRHLRQMYPSLAEDREDLSNHMSDWDFLNVFASPSSEPFEIFINYEAFSTEAIRDEEEACKKIVIPRGTYVVGDGRQYTMHYPLVIRYYDVGNLEVSYDTTLLSQFQLLETNVIPCGLITTSSGAVFIRFSIKLQQLEISRVTDTTSKGQRFVRSYSFKDQFYYARCWYRNSRTDNKWKEMNTTHGSLNYDRRYPTMILTVENNTLRCKLPQMYMANDLLLGEIAVDIYTTHGNLNERLDLSQYTINFREIDVGLDRSIFTPAALSEIDRWAIPTGVVSGGKDGLSFEDLRKRVIYNSTGPQELPISPSQLEASVQNNGFEISKEIDVVTDRVYFATRRLPPPRDKKLTTTANLGVHTFIVEGDTLTDHEYVKLHNKRWTLTPDNLYEYTNGVIRLLPAQDVKSMLSMEGLSLVKEVNSKQYLYTPFHYVFDNNDLEFDLRAYYLDKPEPGLINFVRTNPTLQLVVNTQERSLERTAKGYRLNIKTLSSGHFQDLPDTEVSAQLSLSPKGDDTAAFIQGYISSKDGKERVFSFDLNTTFDINNDDAIAIYDTQINNNPGQTVWAALESEMSIFICTNSLTPGYKPDASNKLYASWIQLGFVPITHEKIQLTFGQPLHSLWRRARNQKKTYDYQTYGFDKQAVYENDVYEKDAVTGSTWTILNGKPERKIKHKAGDLKVDPVTNEPIWEHRATDTIFENGLPLPLSGIKQAKEVDILFIDGRHYFVTDPAYKDYNQELVDLLVDWIVDGLEVVNNRTLEKTKVFFHPKAQIGEVKVDKGDGMFEIIPAEQSPRIDIYLLDNVYEDQAMRNKITSITNSILDKELGGVEFNNSSIVEILKKAYGSIVKSFRLHGFGPRRDIYYGSISSPDKRLSLKRLLEVQADGEIIIREDVTYNFRRAKATYAMEEDA